MNAKKLLLQAARKQQHRKEIQRMSKTEAMEVLRNLKKEDAKNGS